MTGNDVEGRLMPLHEVVGIAREHLRLDAVGIVEVRGDLGWIRAWAGKGGFAPGAELPAKDSYADLILRGAVPALVLDATARVDLGRLPLITWLGARSLVGVPLHLSDGSPYGVLAGMSCSSEVMPGERDVQFFTTLGELIRPTIEAGRRDDDLRTELQTVIETGRVAIAYQPIVDLASGRCLGVEALSRFAAPFASPADAFSAAQRTGLGVELEELAVSKAWPARVQLGADQFLAINLSPAGLAALAPRARARPDVDLHQIVVELTEHSVVDSYARLRSELGPLRQRGLRLAVDDAGAGYASLRHIIELAPDIVKVDASLVQGVAASRARQVAVKSFAALSDVLDTTIVAEGIETPEDLDALLQLGITAGQGHLLARPSVDPADLDRWIRIQPTDIQQWLRRPMTERTPTGTPLRVAS